MSISNCALSGLPLKHPVVSIKSGHIFEKEVIIKHLQNTGQCPLTGLELNPHTDLVEIKTENASLPKPLVANNVPNLISLL